MMRPPTPSAPRDQGFTLIIVMILLVVLSLLVVAHLRRGQIDQRLAANVRQNIELDQATETVLRWCEGMVVKTYQGGGSLANVQATTSGQTPLWFSTSDNFAASGKTFFYTYPAPLNLQNLTAQGCIVEQLPPARPPVDPGPNYRGPIGVLHFRITAQVVANDSALPSLLTNGHSDTLQSELRIVL